MDTQARISLPKCTQRSALMFTHTHTLSAHTAHPLALEVFLLAWRWLVPGTGSLSSVRCCSGSWDVAAAAAAVVTLMVFFRFATCKSSKARTNAFPKGLFFFCLQVFFSFTLGFFLNLFLKETLELRAASSHQAKEPTSVQAPALQRSIKLI